MIFRCIPVGILQANCYIIGCPKTHEAAIIDPGAEPELIMSVITKNQLKPVKIINTHGHPDHIGANRFIKEITQAPILIHAADKEMLLNPLPMPFDAEEKVSSPPADLLISEGDIIKVGELSLEIMETPGHSPGSICLKMNNILLTGDTLFAGTIGRTDLPGGSIEAITQSIKQKLLALPGDTEVYPGHGPSTTIHQEKHYNPFFSDYL
jgi:glyoxylase-like metal-dependent hydrolase (beta-lactamase superfamily II)